MPALIGSGVGGIVVGQLDMATNNRMLARGFGRLLRVIGALCGDYRFDAFSDGFLNSANSDAVLVGVFGVKDCGSELRPKPGKMAPAKSAIPGRYFDPSTYSNRCQKA